MERMNAIAVAANVAPFDHLLCRLDGAGSHWTAQIMTASGEYLYAIETDEEANLYIAELWDEDEDES